MSLVLGAADAIARQELAGLCVVLERTTLPGTTRKLLKPGLEANGLVVGRDAFVFLAPSNMDHAAHVGFYDPLVHICREVGNTHSSVELSAEMLAWEDAVVIVTDHEAVDYPFVADHALLIFDTRNVTAGLRVGKARVRGLVG